MGLAGRDATCGWAVVQLDHDKKEEPWYAKNGTMLAELEAKNNQERLCRFQLGQKSLHTNYMGIVDGLWSGEWAVLGRVRKRQICGSRLGSQQSRVMGVHYGAFRVDWTLHQPCEQYGHYCWGVEREKRMHWVTKT